MARRRRRGGFLLFLVLLAALGTAAWSLREHIPGPWASAGSPELAGVSEETALQAEAKLEQLRGGREEVSLSDAEVTSLLRYRAPPALGGMLHDPHVTFVGEEVQLRGRVSVADLPDLRELRAARSFLPDTAEVSVLGRLRPLEDGRAVVKVEGASFARMPVPKEVYTSALRRMGRTDEPGLAPDEYPVRLPPGVGSARVESGRLVLGPAR